MQITNSSFAQAYSFSASEGEIFDTIKGITGDVVPTGRVAQVVSIPGSSIQRRGSETSTPREITFTGTIISTTTETHTVAGKTFTKVVPDPAGLWERLRLAAADVAGQASVFGNTLSRASDTETVNGRYMYLGGFESPRLLAPHIAEVSFSIAMHQPYWDAPKSPVALLDGVATDVDVDSDIPTSAWKLSAAANPESTISITLPNYWVMSVVVPATHAAGEAVEVLGSGYATYRPTGFVGSGFVPIPLRNITYTTLASFDFNSQLMGGGLAFLPAGEATVSLTQTGVASGSIEVVGYRA